MTIRATYIIVLLLIIGPLTHGWAQSRQEAEIVQDIREIVLKPLRVFESERPTNCNSENLETAYSGALTSARLAPDLVFRQMSADLTLDVADSALRHGCLDFADKAYRNVISTYVGLGFAAHRQRAQIGIDDVRAAKKTK